MWDFSKGRPQKIVDYGMPDVGNGGNIGQCLNPAFVHALAVPEFDMLDKLDKICIMARGDGVVDVINIELELAAIKSKSSLNPKRGIKTVSQCNVSPIDLQSPEHRGKLPLDPSLGGILLLYPVWHSHYLERGGIYSFRWQ